MKTAISIPDPIFAAAEKLARRLGISRSQLYSEAVDALIEKHRYSGVTEQLNAVYEANPEASRLEQEVEELQSRSVTEKDW
jgi:transposase-like protein